MNRRGFLGGILALGAAPAVVKASSLMVGRVWTPEPRVMYYGFTPGYYGLTVEEITREALRFLNEKIDFASQINRELPQDWGSGTIKIRRPSAYRRIS